MVTKISKRATQYS